MMSILIKGIKMPKSCFDCPCCNGENGYCQLRKEYVYGEVPRSCPLLELPPHGDLIDRDETMNEIFEARQCYDAVDFAGVVNAMPTIIESEE